MVDARHLSPRLCFKALEHLFERSRAFAQELAALVISYTCKIKYCAEYLYIRIDLQVHIGLNGVLTPSRCI